MNEISTSELESNIQICSINQLKTIEIEATAEELITLEHIADKIPLTTWSIIFCEMCEGFVSLGTYQIMQNYIQFPLSRANDKQPGALNRGQQTATALTISYTIFCFLTPIITGIITDQFWGRYKTIVVSCFMYLIGLVILVLSSIPLSIENGIALPGLICAMIIMGFATGGFKTASGPLMAEQYTRTIPIIKEINGKKKIIDPKITIESIFNWSCCAFSLGTLISIIILSSIERYHSFWLAYLIPLCIFPVCIIILFINRQRYIRVLPTNSILIRGFRIILKALRNRWKFNKNFHNKHWLDYAKETILINENQSERSQHENKFIDDLKETFNACRVFVFFPFFWICYNQVSSNLTSQAAQMNVGPIPNDIFGSLTSFFVFLAAPIFDKTIYPTLRRCKIKFGPIKRMTFGFLAASFAIGYTAIIQYLIYSREPNFNYKIEPCSICQTYNNINVGWQLPSYFFLSISEVLAYLTGLEYAFTKAPITMKSIVMSLFLCTAAIGGLLNLALIPVNVDPMLLWMYVAIAILTFIITIIFYLFFRNDEKQILPISQSIRRVSILSIRGCS